jgi:hypothetical protein
MNLILKSLTTFSIIARASLGWVEANTGHFNVKTTHTTYIIGLLMVGWLLMPQRLDAQPDVLLAEEISLRNDYGYEIIGRIRDRILLYRDRYENFEVQAYDDQMRSMWSRELEGIDRRGTQILSVLPGRNDFSVIYQVRRRAVTYLRVNKYDPAANLIDTMTFKTYPDRVFTPPEVSVVSSEDRNCLVAYNTAEKGKVECVCFRLDKMEVLWDKTAAYESDFTDVALRSLIVNNQGDLYITAEYDNRKAKIEDHRIHVLRINQRADRIYHVPMPTTLTSDFKCVFDHKNLRLVIAGLVAEKNRDRSNGTFVVRLPADVGDTTTVMGIHHFDDKFISVLRRKDVEDDTRGITDADVSHLLLRDDGGVVIISERHYEINRGTMSGRGFMRDGNRLIIDYYYDDLFMAAHHPDGKMHWETVLHKKQYSQDDDATFSSYMIMRGADRMHFLFNDEIKFENTCSEYVISPLGQFDRNSLLNTFSQNLRLRFRDGIQISATECIVPSEARNKLRLVLLRF